jgi:hypothetical protein
VPLTVIADKAPIIAEEKDGVNVFFYDLDIPFDEVVGDIRRDDPNWDNVPISGGALFDLHSPPVGMEHVSARIDRGRIAADGTEDKSADPDKCTVIREAELIRRS